MFLEGQIMHCSNSLEDCNKSMQSHLIGDYAAYFEVIALADLLGEAVSGPGNGFAHACSLFPSACPLSSDAVSFCVSL